MHDRRMLLAGVVLLAVVVRLAGIGDRLAEDEGFSWLVASAPDAATFLERLAAYENTPPLFYLLLAPLPLDDEHWLRVPALIPGIAAVPVLYLAVRPLLGTTAALLAALGLAVAPYAVSWSNFSRGFMLANLGLLLALWAVARLATGGRQRWWWLYAGGTVVAVYSAYNAAFFLVALIGAFALIAPGRRREVLAFGALPALALLPWAGEFARSLEALDVSKAAPVYPHPGPRSLRDAVVPLFTGEHGAAGGAGLRTLQFMLIAAALAAAVAILARARCRPALFLLGGTALGTLLLHALAVPAGPDIFAQRYLTSLVPLAVALLAGGVALAPWRPARPLAVATLLLLGTAVFVQRHDRELEPAMEPVAELLEQSGSRTLLTNSARAAFYLRGLDPRLDRPLGFGADAEKACGGSCPLRLAIVDDARSPVGVRAGPGEEHRFGPVSVRLRPPPAETLTVGDREERLNPLTCNLAMIVSAALGGGGDARALPVTMQDDALLLHRPPAQVQQITRRMAALGVDRVRLTAGWSTLAPKRRAKQRPRFDARRSVNYPQAPWQKLDTAVRAAHDAGLDVQVDVAFFAPRWGVRRGIRTTHPNRQRWEPKPREFALFTEAVARRYSGHHADPARRGDTLPAVRLWTTWNEPNHAAFLLPQWQRRNGRWVPRSPHLYRRMHERSHRVLKRVNPENQVLIGGLAASGYTTPGERRHIPPLRFVRAMACVDRKGRPLTAGECANFRPLQADGFSHHPYSLYHAPDMESLNPDDVTIGDLERLSKLFDRLHASGRITSRWPIYITEYGYESDPPDHVRGVSLEDQARYIGQSTFVAWRRPDVRQHAQFLLNDIAPPPDARAGSVEATRDWQSGLYFHDGRAKPAVQAFKMPFWAEARSFDHRNLVVLFGQIRPGDGRKRVSIEIRDADGIWRPAPSFDAGAGGDDPCGQTGDDFATDSEGFYLRAAPYYGPATYRARWIKPNGTSEYGTAVTVGPPKPPGVPAGDEERRPHPHSELKRP